MAKKIIKLNEEQKELRNLVCKNKKELIESKEFFEIGVDGTVIKARVVGAGESAIKLAWFLAGVSTKAKATQQTFFLDWNELPKGFVAQLKSSCGDVEEEEISDEDITTLPVQQALPAK